MAITSTSREQNRLHPVTIVVVVVCWLSIIFEGYDLNVYGSVVPALLHYKPWSLTPAQTGAIGSLAPIGMLFGALLIGTLTDLWGRKITLIGSVALFSVSMGICALAPTPFLFGLFRLIAGLGLGGVIPTATAVTYEYSPPRWRAFTYALMFTGFSVGGILASGLAIPLLTAFGWQFLFWIAAVVPLLIVVPVAIFFLPESIGFLLYKNRYSEAQAIVWRFHLSLASDLFQERPQEAEGSSRRPRAVSSLFTRNYLGATILFWIASFLALFMIFGLNTWLPQIMIKAGYSLGSSLSFLLVLYAGTIIGTLVGGVAMDRFGPKWVILIMFLEAGIVLALLSIRFPLLITYLLVALAGTGTVGTQILLNAYISKCYPINNRATAVAWALGIGRIGAIIGPYFGGLILSWKLGVQWNFYSFAIPAFLGVISIAFISIRPLSDVPTAAIEPEEEVVDPLLGEEYILSSFFNHAVPSAASAEEPSPDGVMPMASHGQNVTTSASEEESTSETSSPHTAQEE